MGILWSILGMNTGRTDDPDPVTGLTSRDRYLITTSWEPVRKNPTETGVAVLLKLFEKHPDYIQLFPFKDIPLSELPQNQKFRAHCNAVIYGFHAIVDKIGDSDILVPILLKVGQSHAPRHVTETHFKNLQVILLDIFESSMSKEAVAAWKKALDVATATMIKGMHQ